MFSTNRAAGRAAVSQCLCEMAANNGGRKRLATVTNTKNEEVVSIAQHTHATQMEAPGQAQSMHSALAASGPQQAQHPSSAADMLAALAVCGHLLDVTAIARLSASSKELRACHALVQQQFPRLLQELLSKLQRGDSASRAAALSWLCGLAGRAAVATASQQILQHQSSSSWLGVEGARLLVAHGARVTCQMVVDAAKQRINGAEVWIQAGAVDDDVPELLQCVSTGRVERLRDLLYAADQLPPPQQLMDALHLAANMAPGSATPPEDEGDEQDEGQPVSAGSSSSQDAAARMQRLLEMVPAAELEHLLTTAIIRHNAAVAANLCCFPAASQLSGPAVLELLRQAAYSWQPPGLVEALGRLPAAEAEESLPLTELLGLLREAVRSSCCPESVAALLAVPRVQQAISASLADELLEAAVQNDMDNDSEALFDGFGGSDDDSASDGADGVDGVDDGCGSMVGAMRVSAAGVLVTRSGLIAAFSSFVDRRKEPKWDGDSGCSRTWARLWAFPVAEQLDDDQLQGVVVAAATRGLCGELQHAFCLPFVCERVDLGHLILTVQSDMTYSRHRLTWSELGRLQRAVGCLVRLPAAAGLSEARVVEIVGAALETDSSWGAVRPLVNAGLSSQGVSDLLGLALWYGGEESSSGAVEVLCSLPAAAQLTADQVDEIENIAEQSRYGSGRTVRRLRQLVGQGGGSVSRYQGLDGDDEDDWAGGDPLINSIIRAIAHG